VNGSVGADLIIAKYDDYVRMGIPIFHYTNNLVLQMVCQMISSMNNFNPKMQLHK